MSATFTTCPKCHHTRLPSETAEPERCPACGLYFAKWLAREQFVAPATLHAESENEADDQAEGWRGAIRERLHYVPERVDATVLYACALLLLLLAIWGWRMYGLDYRDGEMGTSFMHNILLPIHEAGHMIFLPFGEFMNILGGSLFQILLPLICAGAFFWKNKDTFGAGIGIWWAGASLVDLAPYIYDAKEPQLILLTGTTGEDGPHDWIYLLDVFHKVQESQRYGAHVHTVGLLVMLAGLAWSAHTLWRWRRHLHSNPSGKPLSD